MHWPVAPDGFRADSGRDLVFIARCRAARASTTTSSTSGEIHSWPSDWSPRSRRRAARRFQSRPCSPSIHRGSLPRLSKRSGHQARSLKFAAGVREPPLYFLPGLLGETFNCMAILDGLASSQPVYAITARPGENQRPRTIEDMVSGYCEELCAFQPEGPVCLAGYSFSGLLAYEMARQLDARGREVQLLAIFDTGPGRPTRLSLNGALTNLCLFLAQLASLDSRRPSPIPVQSTRGPHTPLSPKDIQTRDALRASSPRLCPRCA